MNFLRDCQCTLHCIKEREEIRRKLEREEIESRIKKIGEKKIQESFLKLKCFFTGCDGSSSSMFMNCNKSLFSENPFHIIDLMLSSYYSEIDKYENKTKDYCVCGIHVVDPPYVQKMLHSVGITNKEFVNQLSVSFLFFIYPNFFDGIYRISLGYTDWFSYWDNNILKIAEKVNNLSEYKNFEKNLIGILGFGGSLFDMPVSNLKTALKYKYSNNENKDSDNKNNSKFDKNDDDDFIIENP